MEEGNQNPPIAEGKKNPWWVKAMFHVLVIDGLLRVPCNPIDILSILALLCMLLVGANVQKDRIIISKPYVYIFLFLVGLSIPTLYENIPKCINLLCSSPWWYLHYSCSLFGAVGFFYLFFWWDWHCGINIYN